MMESRASMLARRLGAVKTYLLCVTHMRLLVGSARTYFFRPGGDVSIAICRIFLFSYLYLHVYLSTKTVWPSGIAAYYQTVNLAAYNPKSLVFLLFPTAPPVPAFADAIVLLAGVSTLAALFGILTRISMILSVLSLTFLASLMYSWEPLWSHQYNVGLLAGLAFMFGRAGDRLSIDTIVARYIAAPRARHEGAYWWPVILGQFAVAAFYFGGFYSKWSTPEFTYDLSWVFSDNLRNSVALPWLIWGRQLPWHVELIVNNPLVWKTAAFAHLATQALPMLAMFSLGKPWLRLLEGAIFVAGVFLLKAIMGFWNPWWILLAAFFIDWEYFLGKIIKVNAPASLGAPRTFTANIVLSYCFLFIFTNLFVIATRFDDSGYNRAYPFSAMTFYSDVAARKPYSAQSSPHFAWARNPLNSRAAETALANAAMSGASRCSGMLGISS